MGLFNKNKEPDMVEREDGLIDYDVYIMSKEEKIFNIILAAIVLFILGYIFYKSYIISGLLALFSLKWPKMRVKQIIEKRKRNLTIQFKDMLYSLSSSLTAGRSVEMGIKECVKDLRIIYPDEECDIIREITYIIRGIEMNETVESMFAQFAERAHLEDIENFVDVFVTCKRTGGDIIQIIRSTSQTIGEKIEVKQEIETLVAGKKFEFKVLMIMPILMMLVLTYMTGGYMEKVFTEIAGRVAVTFAVGLFVASYFVGTKIMKIEV